MLVTDNFSFWEGWEKVMAYTGHCLLIVTKTKVMKRTKCTINRPLTINWEKTEIVQYLYLGKTSEYTRKYCNRCKQMYKINLNTVGKLEQVFEICNAY